MQTTGSTGGSPVTTLQRATPKAPAAMPMEPEINKIVEEATEKVRKETEKRQAINIAKAMISSGNFSPKEIVEYVPGVSIEEVMKLKKS